MSEPSLGERVERLVDDADYRDARSALADVSRVALLAVLPDVEREHRAARRQAVRALGGDDVDLPEPPSAVPEGRQLAVACGAFVLGALPVALVAVPPRGGMPVLDLASGLPVAGVVALAAAFFLGWLERRRQSWTVVRRQFAHGLHLFFAGLWVLFVLVSLPLRRDELDRDDLGRVLVGTVLFLVAAAWLMGSWWRSRASARLVRAPAAPASLGAEGQAELYRRMDRWWRTRTRRLDDRERAAVTAAQPVVLAYLGSTGLVPPEQLKRARRSVTLGRCREPRG